MTFAHPWAFPYRRQARTEICPRIHWRGETTQAELVAVARACVSATGRPSVPPGSTCCRWGFCLAMIRVLGTSPLVDAVPACHRHGDTDLDTLFRGPWLQCRLACGGAAAEMTKWFNTNHHYLVPEFYRDQRFKLGWSQLFDEGKRPRPPAGQAAVLLAPSSLPLAWQGERERLLPSNR